jgi:hypothetical protein
MSCIVVLMVGSLRYIGRLVPLDLVAVGAQYLVFARVKVGERVSVDGPKVANASTVRGPVVVNMIQLQPPPVVEPAPDAFPAEPFEQTSPHPSPMLDVVLTVNTRFSRRLSPTGTLCFSKFASVGDVVGSVLRPDFIAVFLAPPTVIL